MGEKIVVRDEKKRRREGSVVKSSQFGSAQTTKLLGLGFAKDHGLGSNFKKKRHATYLSLPYINQDTDTVDPLLSCLFYGQI